MFHRSHAKQQGFAKEQRIADAQLASLRQLGLISPDKKGFASAWGGTELIPSGSAARTGTNLNNNHTTSRPSNLGDFNDGPSFPEKGEFSLCLITHFVSTSSNEDQALRPRPSCSHLIPL